MPTTQVGNGYAFNLAASEQGVSPYALLEAAWTLPAIIYGIRHQIWIGTFDKAVAPHPVLALWGEMGLIEVVETDDERLAVSLTEGGINMVKMGELFEYEFSMMIQQLEGDTATKPEKYASLRKALAHYSGTYLSPFIGWIKTNSPCKRILDLGGGDGYYLRQLLDGTDGKGILYDKAPSADYQFWDNLPVDIVQGNMLEKDKFFRENEHFFDTIIFSEVLHCLPPDGYNIVLAKMARALAPGGSIFIIEQNENFRLNWRLYDMTQGGFSMDPETVAQIIERHSHLGLAVTEQVAASTHHATRVQHVEADKNAKTH